MRSLAFLLQSSVILIIANCSLAAAQELPVAELAGRLQDRKIREASGLARSQHQPGLMWVINDSGARNIVHAINPAGDRLGEFRLLNARNKDWEDLASFILGDKAYLMIADIGDNQAKRKKRTLYVVAEPTARNHGEEFSRWRIDYDYPDGARDAEAAAIDIANDRALVLSKRDVPPRLYAIALQSNSNDRVIATKLGPVNSLHQPTHQEVLAAPKDKNWFWQPVGMDISADNRAAVILTYRAVYYYGREQQQSWLEALNSKPIRVGIGDFEKAESVAFGDDARTVFVTGESRHSPILRIDFNGVAKKQ